LVQCQYNVTGYPANLQHGTLVGWHILKNLALVPTSTAHLAPTVV